MIDQKVLDALPSEVQKRIKNALQSVKNNDLPLQKFVDGCRQILSAHEFSALFQQDQPVNEEVKMEQLQDIILYSGVDLKAEAEIISKDNERAIGYAYDSRIDPNNDPLLLFNSRPLMECVNKICKSRKVNAGNDVYTAILQVVKRKLVEVYEKMIKASKVRVDEEMHGYIIKINNDIRRQLWVLEQKEKKEFEKLNIEKNESDEKKRLKKVIEEREDLLIKKRMSNSVALAALGIQQKSWMNADDGEVVDRNESQFLSLYSPFNEKDLEKKILSRQITNEDFLFVMERDKRYNKSVFTVQQYYK